MTDYSADRKFDGLASLGHTGGDFSFAARMAGMDENPYEPPRLIYEPPRPTPPNRQGDMVAAGIALGLFLAVLAFAFVGDYIRQVYLLP